MKLGLRDGGSRDQALNASFIWAAVRRWRKVIVPSALVLAVLGMLMVCVFFQPQYEAAAWLRIKKRRRFWHLSRGMTIVQRPFTRPKWN